jgi:hypothetical protein
MSTALELLLYLAGLMSPTDGLVATAALPQRSDVEPALAPIVFSTPEPGSRAARRIIERLDRLDASIVTTKYQHRTSVRQREGYYAWDCSAMVSWVLKRAAPRALEAVDRDRPVAVSYVRMIRYAPTRGSRDGWKRLRHIEEVRPGDIFAWKRPPDFPSKSTGHVGFILSAPEPVPELPGAYKIRIADSSSFVHEDDTRLEEGEGGYGRGTILFHTDGEGHGIAYGWYGNTSGLIETPIWFGRVTR